MDKSREIIHCIHCEGYKQKRSKVCVGFSSRMVEMGELLGGEGVVNILNRLAASSFVTKIHAGENPPHPSCRNAKTRRPASAKSRRYFCLSGLYSTSSGLCQRTHAH